MRKLLVEEVLVLLLPVEFLDFVGCQLVLQAVPPRQFLVHLQRVPSIGIVDVLVAVRVIRPFKQRRQRKRIAFMAGCTPYVNERTIHFLDSTLLPQLLFPRILKPL